MKKIITKFLNGCWDIIKYVLEAGHYSRVKALNDKKATDKRQIRLENRVLKRD